MSDFGCTSIFALGVLVRTDQQTADVCVFFTRVKALICLHDFRIMVPIFHK